MMKKLLYPALCTLSIFACRQQEDYKALRKEVIEIHDEVMAKNDRLVGLSMKTDTLLRNINTLKNAAPDTASLRQRLSALRQELDDAEERMNDWMHRFEPDVEGKPNDEAVRYFRSEKNKILQIDSLYDAAITKAESSLSEAP